jgi:hypothetical protein
MYPGNRGNPYPVIHPSRELGGPEYWLSPEADNDAFQACPIEDGEVTTESPIGSGFHQYPLTPLEGSSSCPPSLIQAPFQTPLEPTPGGLPHSSPCEGFDSRSQLLAQTSWPATPTPPHMISSVSGPHPGMTIDFMLPHEPRQQLDLGYFPPAATTPLPFGFLAAGEGPAQVWGGSTPHVVPSAVPNEDAGARDDKSGAEKVKKKRGRPRLYEDDGTERPRRKPGRPPTYVVSESKSSTSPFQPFRSASTASHASSALSPAWPQLGNQAPKMPVLKDVSSRQTKGKGKERTVSAGDSDGAEEEQDSARQEAIRARNKTAASRYRAKTQAAIATMEAEERHVSSRRQALIACATQLREEVFYLKNEILRQADCGCPLIVGYLAEATRLAYSPASPSGPGRAGSISSGMETMALSGDSSRIVHGDGCLERAGVFGEPKIEGDGGPEFS